MLQSRSSKVDAQYYPTSNQGFVWYSVSYSRETVETRMANGHGIHNYAPFDQWLFNFHFKLTLK